MTSHTEITDEIKQRWGRRRNDHSAGGVAYRRTASGALEIALISTRGGSRWQLPKGAREPGETLEQTAIREVREESGLETEVDRFLRTIEYWYWDTYQKETHELVCKRVDLFLLRIVGGELSDASFEVDGVAWFALPQALDLLTYSGERAAVEELTHDG